MTAEADDMSGASSPKQEKTVDDSASCEGELCKDPDLSDKTPDETNNTEITYENFNVETARARGPVILLRGREVIFAIAAFFFFSVCIGLIVVLSSNKAKELSDKQKAAQETVASSPAEVISQEVCVTKSCIQTSAYLMNRMNRTAEPCDDFWQFACGNWLAKHPIPPSHKSWSVSHEVEKRINNVLKRIIESPIERNNDDSAERKVKVLYRKCVDVGIIDKGGLAPMREIIDKLGGWAIFDNWRSGKWKFQRVLQKLHYTFMVQAFFISWVGPDDRHAKARILQFDQSGLSMPFRSQYFLNDSEPVVLAYKEYMRSVAETFNASREVAEEFASSTYLFEQSLAEIQMSDDAKARMDPASSYNRLTINQLTHLAPKIYWLNFLKETFAGVTGDTDVLITNREYMSDLSLLIARTPDRILNYYMIWRLVQRFAIHLSKPIRQAYFLFQQAEKGFSRPQPRWKFCKGVVDDWLGMVLGAMFVRENFPEESRLAVLEMVKNIKNSLSKTISNVEWMDEPTRQAAQDKLQHLKYEIGYPEFISNWTSIDRFYENFEVDGNGSYLQIIINGIHRDVSQLKQDLINPSKTEEWGMNPQEVNAYYSPMENFIVFPAGILQSPFYSQHVPRFINYASVGSTIGHELTHGFDNYGSQYDKYGNLNMWWTPECWKQFQNKTQCLNDYYSQFTVNGMHVNGGGTLGENMADIGGLMQSYDAYKEWERKNGAEHLLPGLEMSNDQVFFLAFAQISCSKRRPQNMADYIRTNNHAPDEVRIRGTLSQMPVFSDAYHCKAGSVMNISQEEICNVW